MCLLFYSTDDVEYAEYDGSLRQRRSDKIHPKNRVELCIRSEHCLCNRNISTDTFVKGFYDLVIGFGTLYVSDYLFVTLSHTWILTVD